MKHQTFREHVRSWILWVRIPVLPRPSMFRAPTMQMSPALLILTQNIDVLFAFGYFESPFRLFADIGCVASALRLPLLRLDTMVFRVPPTRKTVRSKR